MGPMEFAGEHKKGLAIGAAAAIAVGAVSLAAVRYDGEPTVDDQARSEHEVSADELRELLTVSTTNVDCETIVPETGVGEVAQTDNGPVVIYDVGATKQVEFGNPDARWWSDALNTPFKTPAEADKADLLKELQATLCEDPVLGGAFANMFANMEVGGTKVVDLNPWLADFAGDPSIINDKASEFMPLQDRAPEAISDDELKTAVDKNQEYQVIAEKLGTLMTRFQNAGVLEKGPTTFNYNLVAGGLVAGGLPEVGLNATQFETAKGVMFVLTKKDGQCLVSLMVNIGDKRPEGVEDICVAPETPVETVPGDTTPATGAPEGPTTTRPGQPTTTGPQPTAPPTTPRPELGVSPNSSVVDGPGAGGDPDPDNNPDNNPTTSTTQRPATSSTTQAPVPTVTQPPTSVATSLPG